MSPANRITQELQPSGTDLRLGRVVVTEAPHGTAPSLKGKNIANPMAMILAGAALLSHIDNDPVDQGSKDAGKGARAVKRD